MKKFLSFSFAVMMLTGAGSLHAAASSDATMVPSDSESEAFFNLDVVEVTKTYQGKIYVGNVSHVEFVEYYNAGTKQRSIVRQWIREGRLMLRADLEPAKKTKLSAQFDADDDSGVSEKESIDRNFDPQRRGTLEKSDAVSDLSAWVDLSSDAQLNVVTNDNMPDWPETNDDNWHVIFDPAGLANKVESRVPNKLELPAESIRGRSRR